MSKICPNKRDHRFYCVRRAAQTWQPHFFALMARASDQQFDFPRTFTELFASTGRVDASFASKLYATLHPDAPVIDSIVMEYPGPVHHRPETLGL